MAATRATTGSTWGRTARRPFGPSSRLRPETGSAPSSTGAATSSTTSKACVPSSRSSIGLDAAISRLSAWARHAAGAARRHHPHLRRTPGIVEAMIICEAFSSSSPFSPRSGGPLPMIGHPRPPLRAASPGRRVLSPDATPQSLVLYMSDRSGWQAEDDDAAEALRAGGSVVVESTSRCLRQGARCFGRGMPLRGRRADDLAQDRPAPARIDTYLPPILAGRGEGATFAYAAVADAPVNTLRGGVGTDFANRLTLRQPFCPGAKATRTRKVTPSPTASTMRFPKRSRSSWTRIGSRTSAPRHRIVRN